MRTALLITEEAIKVAKGRGKHPTFLKIPLEPGIITGDTIVNRDKLKVILAKVARQFGLTHSSAMSFNGWNEVVLGILEKHLFTKKITVADHAHDMEQKINQDLHTYLPMASEDSYTDWEIAEKTDDATTILAVAATAKFLDECLEILQEVGIHPVAIESLAVAIARHVPKTAATVKNAKPQAKKDEKQKEPVDAPGVKLVVAFEDDEVLLIILNEKNQIELTSSLPRKIIQKTTDLVEEITTMKSFYEKKHGSLPFANIYLTGEGVSEEIKSALANSFPVNTGFLAFPNTKGIEALSFFPISCLLDANIDFKKDHSHINLLPIHLLEQQGRTRKTFHMHQIMNVFTACFMLFSLMYLVILGYFFMQDSNLQSQITKEKESLKSGNLATVVPRIQQVNRNITAINTIKNDKVSLLAIMDFLATKTPGGITVTSYKIDVGSNLVTLGGLSIDRDRLLSFKQVLEGAEQFQNVNIPLTSLEKKGTSTFSLSFEIKQQ